MTDKPEIHVMTHFKVPVEHDMAALNSIRSILEPTRFRRGCLGFRLFREVGEAGSLLIEEKWRTQEDFEQHVRSKEYRMVLETLECAFEPPGIQICDVRAAQGMRVIQDILEFENGQDVTREKID